MDNDMITSTRNPPATKKQRIIKWSFIVSCIALVIVLLLYIFVFPYTEIPRIDGTKYEQKITKNVQKIFYAYTEYDSFVYLIKSRRDSHYTYMDGTEEDIIKLLDDGGRYICIWQKPSSFQKMDENPSEIYSIIRVLLYLKDNPVNITGVQCFYYMGIFDSLKSYQVIISYEKFNELYNQFYNSNVSDKENTKILADKWMEETQYVKGKAGIIFN